jgi:hypothetical protein
MAAMASLFERLDKGRLSPTERAIKQPPRRREDPKILLKDVLANGPVPATLVEERGAAHGFTKIQIRYARRQMNIISFKETGKRGGRWFWVLPHDNRGIPAEQVMPSTPYL